MVVIAGSNPGACISSSNSSSLSKPSRLLLLFCLRSFQKKLRRPGLEPATFWLEFLRTTKPSGRLTWEITLATRESFSKIFQYKKKNLKKSRKFASIENKISSIQENPPLSKTKSENKILELGRYGMSVHFPQPILAQHPQPMTTHIWCRVETLMQRLFVSSIPWS